MVIRRLKAEDYDDLLTVLNRAFNNPDFTKVLPRMWVRSDEYMGKHIGAFEDGKLCAVVGIYPLPVVIGDVRLKFATTGNVATLPEYEGRGYFRTLFTKAMEILEQEGYDAARLGGDRRRYARYGYEPCGQLYKFAFTGAERRSYFDNAYESVELVQLQATDTRWLTFTRELANSKRFYVERYGNDAERDVYRTMCGKKCTPYIALRAGEPIGYLCVNDSGRYIFEMRAYNTEDFMQILCAWQAKMGERVTVAVAPYMTGEVAALADCAYDVSVVSPSRFKILRWDRVCDSLMKLAYATRKMPEGEFCLQIQDYGMLRFFVNATGAGCVREDSPEAALTLPASKAAPFLFGPFQPSMTVPERPELNAWFPLPLSWNVLDYV